MRRRIFDGRACSLRPHAKPPLRRTEPFARARHPCHLHDQIAPIAIRSESEWSTTRLTSSGEHAPPLWQRIPHQCLCIALALRRRCRVDAIVRIDRDMVFVGGKVHAAIRKLGANANDARPVAGWPSGSTKRTATGSNAARLRSARANAIVHGWC
jgi:hypothetical protein